MDYRNFVGGQWLETTDSTPNVNPSDISDILGYAAKAGVDQLDQAIDAAHQAAPGWAASTPQQRFDGLAFVGPEHQARKAELGRLLSREEG
ncbi:MAG: aldehyde dehydrogenase family protein, partial [Pseudomonadota bacterium]|nr:aldehyde dehydrogenase family protein [Pseudomonadota bacterium]